MSSAADPVGICGSGLICLLGEMLLKGVIDQSGHFNMEMGSYRLVQLENTRGFVLEWASNTAGNKGSDYYRVGYRESNAH